MNYEIFRKSKIFLHKSHRLTCFSTRHVVQRPEVYNFHVEFQFDGFLDIQFFHWIGPGPDQDSIMALKINKVHRARYKNQTFKQNTFDSK